MKKLSTKCLQYQKYIFISVFFLLFSSAGAFAQAQMGGTGVNANGQDASAIGFETTANGTASFAGGFQSIANGSSSFSFGSLAETQNHYTIAMGKSSKALSSYCMAFGDHSTAGNTSNIAQHAFAIGNYANALSSYAFAFGSYVKANVTNSFVFGKGVSATQPLTGVSNGITFAVNSTVPTMVISGATGGSTVGKVGIGTIMPLAPLHLKAGRSETCFDGDGVRFLSTGFNYITASNGNGSLAFKTGGNDQEDIKMVITPTGEVGIGTSNTFGYKLAVNGSIGCQEVKLEANTPWPDWPDYVFNTNYKLSKLNELEEFIKKNKHLPEIPSAEEIEQDGIELGKMSALLLKKIEELTLHTIEQQKMIEKQQEIMGLQQIKMSEMEQEIKKLKEKK